MLVLDCSNDVDGAGDSGCQATPQAMMRCLATAHSFVLAPIPLDGEAALSIPSCHLVEELRKMPEPSLLAFLYSLKNNVQIFINLIFI